MQRSYDIGLRVDICSGVCHVDEDVFDELGPSGISKRDIWGDWRGKSAILSPRAMDSRASAFCSAFLGRKGVFFGLEWCRKTPAANRNAQHEEKQH